MDTLRERGFIKQTVYEDELYEKLGSESVPFYIGFDPTADSLHVGHFMQLIAMTASPPFGSNFPCTPRKRGEGCTEGRAFAERRKEGSLWPGDGAAFPSCGRPAVAGRKRRAPPCGRAPYSHAREDERSGNPGFRLLPAREGGIWIRFFTDCGKAGKVPPAGRRLSVTLE